MNQRVNKYLGRVINPEDWQSMGVANVAEEEIPRPAELGGMVGSIPTGFDLAALSAGFDEPIPGYTHPSNASEINDFVNAGGKTSISAPFYDIWKAVTLNNPSLKDFESQVFAAFDALQPGDFFDSSGNMLFDAGQFISGQLESAILRKREAEQAKRDADFEAREAENKIERAKAEERRRAFGLTVSNPRRVTF